MADEQVVTAVTRPPLWQTIAKWVGVVLAGLVLLVVAVVLGIDTQPGRRFVADRIAGYTLASGLNVKVGRIDGSLYGAMILRDVRVQDQKGVFATSPELRVDWRPFAFVNSHVDVRSLASPLVSVARLPELKAVPSDPNAPTLPDLDIDIGRFAIDRIDLAPAVSGTRRLARVAGNAHIADRRAQVVLDGATVAGPGIAGGDRVALRLDAVPDDDKLDLDLKLSAPRNGLIGGMASLEAPLTLAIDGKGAWSAWTGRAVATLGGGQLADLGIEGHSGTFKVRGTTQPGLYLKGPVERLTAPRLDVAIDTTLADRKADTRIQLRSSALNVSAQGLLDLAASRFGNFRADAMLLTPGSIAPNLNGRSVRLQVALDGPFGTPVVDYKLSADAIGFGAMGVEGLYAEGKARVDTDRIMVPIAARARRVTGLNAAAGGLLTNVAINGDLAINHGTEILSDNLKLRSDRIDATAIVAADLAKGRYAGALKGRINDYRVDGIGILNLTTDAKLYTVPSGGFGIRGRVVAQTSRIFNDGARTFLGGNAIARVDLDYTPAGIINFSGLRVTAPQFRVTNGSGRYDPAGPLLVNADAYSTQYGPLSARVTGTIAAPVVMLRAARPGLGVGLVNVQATIRGQGSRYAIVGSGGSNYGPFSADLVLGTAPRLSADIRTARFAGIDFHGRVEQTSAGPFAGRLQFAGSGVNGTLGLSAQGRYQRADVDARAANAVIPGTAGLTIGRAIVTGTAVLYPNQPSVTGDAQVANLKMGTFLLKTARVKADYRGGSGTAQAFAEGSSGVPFRIGANARFSPKLWLVALQGTANSINFRTASPARIEPVGGTYRLQPTRIDFDQGSVRLAGSYGKAMSLQARLDKLDMSIANAFVPGLGIGGTATGSVDFAQATSASVPRADVRLNIANFTRSSLASASTPVNIVFAGGLTEAGGEGRALIQRGTTTVGRLVATLRPLGSGGSWTSRLLAAPLGGGIRYNGPAAVLFSFAGFSGQQLSGALGVAADFGGRLDAPRLTGVVRGSNLTYENEIYGTRLTNMRVAGQFTNDRFELTELAATAGDGTVSAQGSVGLAAASGFPIDVRATLNNARLARSDALGATATGTIRVTNSQANGGLIQGELTIPQARYEIIRQGAAEVAELTGVRRKSDVARAAAAGTPPPAPPGLFKLDLRVSAPNQLFVSGMGLESEWEADIRIGGTSAAPNVTGEAKVVRGTFSFSGKRFELTRGIVRFRGGPIGDPELDIVASTTTQGITATISIGGRAQQPQLTFASTPNLPQDEVLSRLLFGSSVTNLSATEAIQLAAALNSLRGSSGGGLNPLGKLRSATGFDRLRILGADQTSGRGTALAAGKYITKNIYIEIVTDARGFTATQLEIALSKALSLLSATGSFGGSNVNLRYSKDY